MREDGRLTGRVGDLTLGLTKPGLLPGDTCTGAGVAFLPVVVVEAGVADLVVFRAPAAVVVVLDVAAGFSVDFFTGSRVALAACAAEVGWVAVLEGMVAFLPGGLVAVVWNFAGCLLADRGAVLLGLVAFATLVPESPMGARGFDGALSAGDAGRSLGVGVSTSTRLSGFRLGLSVTAPSLGAS